MSKKSQLEYIGTDSLIPFASNSRTHSPEQVAQIAGSIREFGFTNPVLIDGENGIIAGHGRVMAAQKLGITEVPCLRLGYLTEAQKRAYVIADNKLALNAGWDEELLRIELKGLEAEGFDLGLIGFSSDEIADLISVNDNEAGAEAGSLAERFLLPPFSVLNAREGWWQDRKRSWLALGIKSEEGRPDAMTFRTDGPDYISQRIAEAGGGTSVFDPVLCEVAYTWFCPAGGTVLDPFAGGSVRGIVASKLGRQYVGHELRAEQVEANRQQAEEICIDDELSPVWVVGDSRNIARTCHDVRADLVFTCPPYADLEVYSDDPSDISTLGYPEFLEAYREIIARSCELLKPDSFAVCVVGEVRGKDGNYYDFVGDTVEAFQDAGLHYYNEAILVTAVGSLPIRAGRQFSASRKLGKTHQNVLVFVKGDGKKAAVRCGEITPFIPEEQKTSPAR